MLSLREYAGTFLSKTNLIFNSLVTLNMLRSGKYNNLIVIRLRGCEPRELHILFSRTQCD
jgi:hypothetical protein